MLPKRLEDWLDQAMAQLRSRRAAASVRQELAQHLADQYQALRDRGMDPDAAAEQAAREMGDPVLVGGQLDRVHRPRPALIQALPVALLFAVGELLQWMMAKTAAGTLNGARVWLGISGSLGGAAVCAALSLAVLLLTARFVDLALLERHAWAVYLGCLAVEGGLLLINPAGGRSSLGAAMGLAFLPIWAGVLYRQRGRYLAGLLTAVVAMLPGPLLCVLALQTEMAVLVGLCCFVLCVWCCAKDWFGLGARLSTGTLLLAASLGLATFLLLYLDGVPPERLTVRLLPTADPEGAGYLSLYLRGLHQSTRLLGQGTDPALLGGIFAQYPEGMAQLPIVSLGDWQLSYLAWRFGLLPVLLLAAGCAAGLGLLWRAALRCRNALGRLIAIGCALALSGGLLANLLGNLGLPVGGFLPFLGRGGTMHCAEALLAGLLLAAFRTDPVRGGTLAAQPAAARAVGYCDGVLTIRLRR